MAATVPHLGVLLICEIDVVAAPVPSPNAALELCDVFRVASQDKGAQAVDSGKMKVSGLPAYGGPAISLYEVDTPEFAIVLEIQQHAGHSGIVGQQTTGPGSLVVDGNRSPRGCGHFGTSSSIEAEVCEAHSVTARGPHTGTY